MQQYIDIHTHQSVDQEGVHVFNLEEAYSTCKNYSSCSLGIHPWYVSSFSIGTQLAELKRYASFETVIAIGECGLDKQCNTPWALQEAVFSAQIRLANELKKPLIIHCVRAFSEVLSLLKKNNNTVPVIFHGFRKTRRLADLLLENGCYLSFGASILQSQPLHSLAGCPLDRLFLETDNAAIPIALLYEKTASVLRIPLETLVVQIQHNFNYIKTICKT